MATNRTLQQKRKAGCLKGGSASVTTPSPSPTPSPTPPPPSYGLAQVSGLKIRFLRRDVEEEKEPKAKLLLQEPHAVSAFASLGYSDPPTESTAETIATTAFNCAQCFQAEEEEEEEELLEEPGDDDYSNGNQVENTEVAALPTCIVDVAGGMTIVAGIDGVGLAGVRRLKSIATLPLTQLTATAATVCRGQSNGDGEGEGDGESDVKGEGELLAILRGVGLADLVDRLYARRVALVAEVSDVSEGEGEGEGDDKCKVESQLPPLLLLVPVGRLPWPSLAVCRPPPSAPSSDSERLLSPPEWWRDWDGPPSGVKLNCIRRSRAFLGQFGDQRPL